MGKARRWAGILAATVALGFLGASCASAPAPQCGMDPTSAAIFNDVNVSRNQNGLPSLAPNGQLTCLAQGWSAYMAATNSFEHRNLSAVLASPGYGGYHTLGENILEGPAGMTADQMHTAWMNSPDHRANILDGAYSSLGIGLAYANGQVWATEDFGG
ncbi:MAG TPA: CAP domain-containing protein [Acidimicrobiia bacterium]|nr:CAP domain-containing protein [Acidimicrobiia bacterium]